MIPRAGASASRSAGCALERSQPSGKCGGAGNSPAEWIVHGQCRTVDRSAFGHERVAENRPFREMNII